MCALAIPNLVTPSLDVAVLLLRYIPMRASLQPSGIRLQRYAAASRA